LEVAGRKLHARPAACFIYWAGGEKVQKPLFAAHCERMLRVIRASRPQEVVPLVLFWGFDTPMELLTFDERAKQEVEF
jgi:hypothetical protein